MTLTTHRTLTARALHAALDVAVRVGKSLRAQRRARTRPSALCVLDDAAMRDLGIVQSEFEAYGAEASGEVEPSYRRLATLRPL